MSHELKRFLMTKDEVRSVIGNHCLAGQGDGRWLVSITFRFDGCAEVECVRLSAPPGNASTVPSDVDGRGEDEKGE